MGKQLTPAEEAQVLREVIREAHECLKDLRAAIREARTMADNMIREFETVHAREIHQLSNYFTEESNRQCALLNDNILTAREMISKQIMSGVATFDPRTEMITISWGLGGFEDHAPLPYPDEKTPEQHP